MQRLGVGRRAALAGQQRRASRPGACAAAAAALVVVQRDEVALGRREALLVAPTARHRIAPAATSSNAISACPNQDDDLMFSPQAALKTCLYRPLRKRLKRRNREPQQQRQRTTAPPRSARTAHSAAARCCTASSRSCRPTRDRSRWIAWMIVASSPPEKNSPPVFLHGADPQLVGDAALVLDVAADLDQVDRDLRLAAPRPARRPPSCRSRARRRRRRR